MRFFVREFFGVTKQVAMRLLKIVGRSHIVLRIGTKRTENLLRLGLGADELHFNKCFENVQIINNILVKSVSWLS